MFATKGACLECQKPSNPSNCRRCVCNAEQAEPNLSLGTVYRNLNFLADHKLIRKFWCRMHLTGLTELMEIITICSAPNAVRYLTLEHDLAEELLQGDSA